MPAILPEALVRERDLASERKGRRARHWLASNARDYSVVPASFEIYPAAN